MSQRALDALARRYRLASSQAAQLLALLEALAEDPHAPTGVREPGRAVDAHLADSLCSLELAQVRGASTIADLGSGAGFPGVPIAIALPQSEVRLLESQRRKCAFIEQLTARLGLGNVLVRCVRAEEWREGLEANDAVLARALGPQPVVLEYAAPLLRLGGALVDWRGRRDESEEHASARAAEELGLRRLEIRRSAPYVGASEHHLHVFQKVHPTPARYPRRAGIARKRPLGR